MRLFRSNQPNPKWHKFAPHKLMVGAYLLVDDVCHRSINRGGDFIENKLGVSKSYTALALVTVGSVAGASIMTKQFSEEMYNSPYWINWGTIKKLSYFPLLIALATPAVFLVYDAAKAFASKGNELAERFSRIILRAIRLSIFLAGIGTTVTTSFLIHGANELSKSAQNFGFGLGIYLTCFGIASYLVSSSNGVLDRVKEFLFPPVGQKAEVKATP